MIAITVLAALAPQCAGPAQTPTFSEPIHLLADDAPLGADLLYPSPRIHDIDRDGDPELVVADLRGRVLYAERVPGDVATWTALEPFTTDGRPLKFHNW